MAQDEPAKGPETKPELPPIPPDRIREIECPACHWNAWVSIPTKVRALYHDVEDKTGEIRSTELNLIVCSGCGMRVSPNKGPDGTIEPVFSMPVRPLYGDVLSGRVTVSER
jgi:hypothetical protein